MQSRHRTATFRSERGQVSNAEAYTKEELDIIEATLDDDWCEETACWLATLAKVEAERDDARTEQKRLMGIIDDTAIELEQAGQPEGQLINKSAEAVVAERDAARQMCELSDLYLAEKDAAVKERDAMKDVVAIARDEKNVADYHYAHHDPQGTAGRNCPACIARGAYRDRLRAALSLVPSREAGGLGGGAEAGGHGAQ